MKHSVTTSAAKAALTLAMAVAPALASAADFTIEVPLELSGIPPLLTQGKVRCVMLFDNNSEASDYVYSTPFAISGGSYAGTARVEINTTRAANVAKYGCVLWVGRNGEAGYVGFTDARTLTGPAAVWPEARLMGHPEFPMVVNGAVPR